MNTMTKIFKEKKLKLTPQRIAVYDYLINTDKHPSAEDIHDDLYETFPTMSLATVYKSLKVLSEVELISEINLGEGNFRYDAIVEDHPHIKCTICNKVEDIEGVAMEVFNKEIRKHTDYNITSNKLYFFGVCRDCQENKE